MNIILEKNLFSIIRFVFTVTQMEKNDEHERFVYIDSKGKNNELRVNSEPILIIFV